MCAETKSAAVWSIPHRRVLCSFLKIKYPRQKSKKQVAHAGPPPLHCPLLTRVAACVSTAWTRVASLWHLHPRTTTPIMSVGTPALLVLTMWWACETAFRPAARRRFGTEFTDGYPRWRVALGCLTQIVIFPLMFLVFVIGRQPWLMESFLLVFGCSLLQDCVRFPRTMGPLLLLHHAACLVGLLVARFGAGPEWRAVFPYFHCGCTALELGSGACNVRPLRRKLSLRVRVGVRVRVMMRVRVKVRVRVKGRPQRSARLGGWLAEAGRSHQRRCQLERRRCRWPQP